MIDLVYIEREVRDHPRTRRILAKLPRARRIECEHYGEVFNRRAQNFRLQKLGPALILARKRDALVLETPERYGVGGELNYYFSHLLNCPYDCRYCFLQGMYRSANYVLFVNFEDFEDAIDETIAKVANSAAEPEHASWFFSGYDCDSLALEGLTGFASSFLPFFSTRPHALLELRTKSTHVGPLLETEPLENVVVAYSLSPAVLAARVEHGAPTLDRRLDAARTLAERGWSIGLRFDPLLLVDDFAALYDELFETTFRALRESSIHSVSLGTFRLPRAFHRQVTRLYPDEPLLATAADDDGSMVSYPTGHRQAMLDVSHSLLERHVPADKIFVCDEPA